MLSRDRSWHISRHMIVFRRCFKGSSSRRSILIESTDKFYEDQSLASMLDGRICAEGPSDSFHFTHFFLRILLGPNEDITILWSRTSRAEGASRYHFQHCPKQCTLLYIWSWISTFSYGYYVSGISTELNLSSAMNVPGSPTFKSCYSSDDVETLPNPLRRLVNNNTSC